MRRGTGKADDPTGTASVSRHGIALLHLAPPRSQNINVQALWNYEQCLPFRNMSVLPNGTRLPPKFRLLTV
jgi:hypothetical protein